MTYDVGSPLTPFVNASILDPAVLDAYVRDRGRSMVGDAYQEQPDVAADYLYFCRLWDLDVDLVLAEAVEETSGFQSAIWKAKRNPAGLGAVDDNPVSGAIDFTVDTNGDKVPDEMAVRAGVQCHVAHMANYVHGLGSWSTYDPRTSVLAALRYLGIVKCLDDLSGRWASDKAYGSKIASVANDMLVYAREHGSMTDLWPTQEELGVPLEVMKADADVGPARPVDSVKWFVVHTTEGHRSSDLQILVHADPAQASVHFWISLQGEIVAIVPINFESWTVANLSVDIAAINVELEGFAKDGATEAQYRAIAKVFLWCRSKGMTVPATYVGKENVPGIIGHQDVSDGHGGWGGASHHTDPGPLYKWQHMVDLINAGNTPVDVPTSNERFFDVDGKRIPYAIHDGFKVYWEKHEAQGLALLDIGYPQSNEVLVRLENGSFTMQLFERGALIYEGGNPPPWDVHHATNEQVAVLRAAITATAKTSKPLAGRGPKTLAPRKRA